MSVTTEETWKVNGTTLNTMAYNIETWSGREGIPPRRGENIVIPYLKGTMWVPKIPDERPLTVAMWVKDSDVDGVRASTEQARRAQLRGNIETLKALFGVYDTLLSLERKIRLPAGLETWTAEAECVGVLPFEWELEHAWFAKLIAELVMPDPYWYDAGNNPKL